MFFVERFGLNVFGEEGNDPPHFYVPFRYTPFLYGTITNRSPCAFLE